MRKVFQGGYMIPAMKHAVAEQSKQPSWKNVRPPLVPLDQATADKVGAELRTIDFAMAGYPTGV